MKSLSKCPLLSVGFLFPFILFSPTVFGEDGFPVRRWEKSFGTPLEEYVTDMCVDRWGNSFACGYTTGSLEGFRNAGESDAMLVKYDAQGNYQWHWQHGGPEGDIAYGVTVDHQGSAYVVGFISGRGFLVKLNACGRCCWKKDITVLSSGTAARGICRDFGGCLYVTGLTRDRFTGKDVSYVRKFSPQGVPRWTTLLGDPQSNKTVRAERVACDNRGSVYVAGWRSDCLISSENNSQDAFLARFDKQDGYRTDLKLWDGGPIDQAYALAVADDGSVFIGGVANHSSGGGSHAFLAKYDHNGVRQWSPIFPGHPIPKDLAVDHWGRVYVVGINGFSIHSNATGEHVWSEEKASGNRQIALDRCSNPYVAGVARLPSGSNLGTNHEGFVIRYDR